MSAFAQSTLGDLLLTDGQLTLVTGAEELAVRARNRLFSVQGEWFHDLRIGIPYFQLVFVGNPNLGIIRQVFNLAFSSLPGLAAVKKIDLTHDRSTRLLTVVTELLANDGSTITGGSGIPFVVETV